MARARQRDDLSQIMLRPDGLSVVFSMSRSKVDSLINEMEGWIPERYPRRSVIRDGGMTLVNRLAFIDYLGNRKLLNEKTASRYAKPYDPIEIAREMAYISIL